MSHSHLATKYKPAVKSPTSMKANIKMTFAYLKWALGIAFVAGLSACSGIDTAEWTEEVELHGGNVILVKRTSRANSIGFPNSSRGSDIDFSLEAAHGSVTWRAPVMNNPIAFDVIEGKTYLVVHHGDGHTCKGTSAFEVAVTFLEWTQGRWLGRSPDSVPVDKMRINLYSKYWGHNSSADATGLITLKLKLAKESDRLRMPLTEFLNKSFVQCNWILKSKNL